MLRLRWRRLIARIVCWVCALALGAAMLPLPAAAQSAEASAGLSPAGGPQGIAPPPTDTHTPPASSTLSDSPPPPLAPEAALPALIQTPHPPRGGWQRQAFTVAQCAAPPVIDGKLDDPCWNTATHVHGFYRFTSDAPVPEQTEAWICTDARHLYFAFHCLDSHPEQIRASETQRNGDISHDDYVGIDIDSQNSRRNGSTFQVSVNGTQVQSIEGGTASNNTWAGDWRAATSRTKDGWTCEIAIPFSLLRYPRGVHAFGMLLYRKLARETNSTGWPYIPPTAFTGDTSTEAPYLSEFGGIAPPFIAPQPILLPYTLVSGGATNAAREGLDAKYPLTTTLTGVASLFPDFQTVEQSVTDVSFSYTEKYQDDQRPFFAEGAGFLPSRSLFYSRSIGDFDGGLKIAGKTDGTTIGLLGTDLQGDDHQDVAVLNLARDIGALSRFGFSGVSDTQAGVPSNQVSSIYGTYGTNAGQSIDKVSFRHLQSWYSGEKQSGDDELSFNSQAPSGKLSYYAGYSDIGPNFISLLGYVPDVDKRGYTGDVSYYNQYDKGAVESRGFDIDAYSYQHHTAGFFTGGADVSPNVSFRNGFSVGPGYSIDQRDQYHDQLYSLNLGWNQKTLYQQGGASLQTGRQAGKSYTFFSVSQGYLVSRPFSLQASYDEALLGSTATTQLVLTGTYRLSPDRTLGGRIIAQDGHTNLFLSYGQQARSGNDVFLIFGDPNQLDTRGEITLKVVHPMTL